MHIPMQGDVKFKQSMNGVKINGLRLIGDFIFDFLRPPRCLVLYQSGNRVEGRGDPAFYSITHFQLFPGH